MPNEQSDNLLEELSAYLDGELDEQTRAKVEAYLASDAEGRRVLAELRQARALLQDLPRGHAPEDFLDSITARLERRQLLGGEVPTAGRFGGFGRRFGRLVASAAVIFLAVTVGYVTYRHVGREPESASAPTIALRDEAPGRTARETPEPARPAPPRVAPKGHAAAPTPRDARAGTHAPDDAGGGAVERVAKGGPVKPGAPRPDLKSDRHELTFEEMVLTNASNYALAQHRFDREPLQVTLVAGDPATLERCSRQVEAFFDRNGVANVRLLPQSGRITPVQEVYLPAQPGVNTAQLGANLYLSRVTPARFASLLNELAVETQLASLRPEGDEAARGAQAKVAAKRGSGSGLHAITRVGGRTIAARDSKAKTSTIGLVAKAGDLDELRKDAPKAKLREAPLERAADADGTQAPATDDELADGTVRVGANQPADVTETEGAVRRAEREPGAEVRQLQVAGQKIVAEDADATSTGSAEEIATGPRLPSEGYYWEEETVAKEVRAPMGRSVRATSETVARTIADRPTTTQPAQPESAPQPGSQAQPRRQLVLDEALPQRTFESGDAAWEGLQEAREAAQEVPGAAEPATAAQTQPPWLVHLLRVASGLEAEDPRQAAITALLNGAPATQSSLGLAGYYRTHVQSLDARARAWAHPSTAPDTSNMLTVVLNLALSRTGVRDAATTPAPVQAELQPADRQRAPSD